MIPEDVLKQIIDTQTKIVNLLEDFIKRKIKNASGIDGYITAEEYMEKLRIKRWKFNDLISKNLIKTIKKKRKIYVPVTEIDRYFNDPTIQ